MAAHGAYREIEKLVALTGITKRFRGRYTLIPIAGPLMPIREWCAVNGIEVTPTASAKTYARLAPKFWGSRAFRIASGMIDTIDEYVVRMDHICNVAGSSILLTGDGTILHDESSADEIQNFAIRDKRLLWRSADNAVIAAFTPDVPVIERGIIVCSAHCTNYFHWLVETLPRILQAKKLGLLAEAPLLIPSGLHPNLYRSIEVACDGQASIQRLEEGGNYHINHAIYVSDRSRILDNYETAYWYRFQSVMNPETIQELHTSFTKDLTHHTEMPRRVFITRSKKTRSLRNEQRLAKLARRAGYEVLDPSSLSFDEQIEYYRSCNVIIATAGAAVANILFCTPQTKIFILVLDFPHLDFYCFSQIADALGLNLAYVLGSRAYGPTPLEHHDDYSIDEIEFYRLLKEN